MKLHIRGTEHGTPDYIVLEKVVCEMISHRGNRWLTSVHEHTNSYHDWDHPNHMVQAIQENSQQISRTRYGHNDISA
jgi:hypothetical protein